jgi:hypothetical protein
MVGTAAIRINSLKVVFPGIIVIVPNAVITPLANAEIKP